MFIPSRRTAPFPEFNAETDFSWLTENDIQRAKEKHKFYNSKDQNVYTNSISESIFKETFLVDKQNSVWQSVLGAGSRAIGLNRDIPISKGFKHYFFEQNPGTGLNAIFPVLKDRFGTVWAGLTNVNQIFRMDKNGKTSQEFPLMRKPGFLPVSHGQLLKIQLEFGLGMLITFYFDTIFKRTVFRRKYSKQPIQTTKHCPRIWYT